MIQATRPYRGRPIVSQGKHYSIIAGKKVDGAVDFILSPWMKLMGRNGLYMPLKAKVTQIVTRTSKRDGSVMYQTEDGKKHLRVHCIPNPKLKVGLWYKQGTKVGIIDPKPINSTGPHDHYAIMTRLNTPVDIVAWHKKYGLINWFQDPNGYLRD